MRNRRLTARNRPDPVRNLPEPVRNPLEQAGKLPMPGRKPT